MNFIRIKPGSHSWQIVDLSSKSFFEEFQKLLDVYVHQLLKQKSPSIRFFRFEINNDNDIKETSNILQQFWYSIEQIQFYFEGGVTLNQQDYSEALINHQQITSFDIDVDYASAHNIGLLSYLVKQQSPFINNLTTLKLTFNKSEIQLVEYKEVMDSIPQIEKLQKLVLRYGQQFYMDSEPQELYNTLSKCINLEQIYLGFSKCNFICQNEERLIAQSLLQCKKLIQYEISSGDYNDVDGFETAKILLDTKINTLSISSFYMNGSPFQYQGLRYIAKKMKRLVHLSI